MKKPKSVKKKLGQPTACQCEPCKRRREEESMKDCCGGYITHKQGCNNANKLSQPKKECEHPVILKLKDGGKPCVQWNSTYYQSPIEEDTRQGWECDSEKLCGCEAAEQGVKHKVKEHFPECPPEEDGWDKVNREVQKLFVDWCREGRPSEQIYGVDNFLTGAFIHLEPRITNLLRQERERVLDEVEGWIKGSEINRKVLWVFPWKIFRKKLEK